MSRAERIIWGLSLLMRDSCEPSSLAQDPPSPFDTDGEKFHSIDEYYRRLAKYSGFSFKTMILAVHNANRVRLRMGWIFSRRKAHGLIFASMIRTARQRQELYKEEKFYADVGGFPVGDMRELEKAFVDALYWDVEVGELEYMGFLHRIVPLARLAGKT